MDGDNKYTLRGAKLKLYLLKSTFCQDPHMKTPWWLINGDAIRSSCVMKIAEDNILYVCEVASEMQQFMTVDVDNQHHVLHTIR